ncbi:hypothetical protein [Calderihabitans maritimus]|uniref:Uncharacterized protein n=1 Tax=Calderihabitans maritimus TaxID=1246530 RepID=A0A1Z5HPJ0_9FIRM|nr:hypothetical protein [Calderihabitans maritimus]GAW91348.1 hypothetical protein KKC1_05100 [Calderihabitans maritimus]
MKDTFLVGSLAGIIGTLAMDLLSVVATLLKIPHSTAIGVAADIFLVRQLLGTPAAWLIGIAGHLVIGMVGGIFTAYLLRYTGRDYAIFKGILLAWIIGMGTVGFVMPLLKISPQIQREAFTNLFAVVSLAVYGGITAYLIARFGKIFIPNRK